MEAANHQLGRPFPLTGFLHMRRRHTRMQTVGGQTLGFSQGLRAGACAVLLQMGHVSTFTPVRVTRGGHVLPHEREERPLPPAARH